MPIERKLAAIMFTDIAGYTALSAKDSTKSSELLKTQRDTLKPIVEKHGGSWMKEIGDGLLLTFDSATSAVECSIAIQEATKDIEDLNLRIGIHEGEVIKQDGDVIGDDVNIASRIEPFSAVGGVAISHKIEQAISSNQEFETKYIGKPKLKGVAQEVKVYCITSHGLPETDISKVSAKLEEESKFNIFALTGGILTAIGIAFWIAVGVFDVSFGGKMEVPSVGILMMENLGKENEEFWASGMTADLITRVSGAGLIRVAPLKDVRNIDTKLSLEEIAKKLRVKYILTHSFLIKDDSFDLWCKLENTENGVALFSNKISEPIDMTTQMVGKLANDIITSLKVSTKQDMMKAPTDKAEAYEYYLRAKFIYKKRENLNDMEVARGLLKKAIEIDSNLFLAKRLLGHTYFDIEEYKKAMEIYTNNLKQAEELGDKYWLSYSLYDIGFTYSFKGNDYRALEYYMRSLEIAKEIDDNNIIGRSLKNIGGTYWEKGDLDIALDYYINALEAFQRLGKDHHGHHGVWACLNDIRHIYYEKGNYDKALDYHSRSLRMLEEPGDKYWVGNSLGVIGTIHYNKRNYNIAVEYLDKSLSIKKEIGLGADALIGTTTHIYLAYKKLRKVYDVKKIQTLVENAEDIEYELNLRLYELLEDKQYLETAYNQVQEKASAMDEELAAKFLSYPIPKAIVEEWEKVK